VRRLWRQFGGADRTSRVAYLRVSSEAQDTQLQRDALGEAGCVKFFEDKISLQGRGLSRPVGLTAGVPPPRRHCRSPGVDLRNGVASVLTRVGDPLQGRAHTVRSPSSSPAPRVPAGRARTTRKVRRRGKDAAVLDRAPAWRGPRRRPPTTRTSRPRRVGSAPGWPSCTTGSRLAANRTGRCIVVVGQAAVPRRSCHRGPIASPGLALRGPRSGQRVPRRTSAGVVPPWDGTPAVESDDGVWGVVGVTDVV
jgi:hypothetical protein